MTRLRDGRQRNRGFIPGNTKIFFLYYKSSRMSLALWVPGALSIGGGGEGQSGRDVNLTTPT
jgi:hypothetical protein